MFLGAGQGDVTLAANQVLLQFLEIMAYGLTVSPLPPIAGRAGGGGAASRPAAARRRG